MKYIKILSSLYLRIKLKLLLRTFLNINDCIKYCEEKNVASYNSVELSNYSFKKFIENIDDFKFSYNSSHKFLLEIILIYISKHNNLPKIIDIGGVFGENKIFLDHLFQNNKIIYDVVEVPNKVVLAKNLKHSKFFDNIDDALKNNYDLIFSSGTLQYFTKPFEVLEKLLESKVKYIGFTRGNYHLSKDQFIAQASPIALNGPGEGFIKLKDKINNKIIYFNNTAMSYLKFKEIINKKNYEIIRETQGIEGQFGKDTFTKNLLLKKL